MTSDRHPTDTDLAAALPAARAHARDCQRCLARLQTPEVPVPSGVTTAEGSQAPPELVRALSGLPDLDVRPTAGELWRLEFDGVAAPVVVAEAENETLLVWAVGEDIEFADAATLALPDAILGIAAGVWGSVEYSIPEVAAERRIATLPAQLFETLGGLRNRIATNEPVGGHGPPFVGSLDPRLRYREQLSEPLALLADLERAPVEAPDASLRALLNEHGIGRQDLLQLGFDAAAVRALGRDRLILDDDEISRIAVAAEQPARYVAEVAPQPPTELKVNLHTPLRRRQLAEKAVRHGISETDERRHAARKILQATMRTEGSGEPDWDQAIDRYLETR